MADEYICDTAEIRSFISKVKEISASTPSFEARLAAIRPLFAKLMGNPDWLRNNFV